MISEKVKKFIKNNKYLLNKKYHKGLSFSQTIFGDGSNCIVCGCGGARHSIKHNRKTNSNGYIHNEDICCDCCNEIQKTFNKKYWDRLEKIKKK